MILFIHGTDTFRSRKKLLELQQKFLNEVDPQGYNLSVLQGGGCTVSKIIESLSSMPFMASKRMIVLEEYSKMNNSDKEDQSLLDMVEAVLEQDTIFVVWEAGMGKRDLKSPFFKVVQKTKYIMPYESWNAQQVSGWMLEEFKKEGIAINSDALNHLSLSVGDNLWLANSEVSKLISYCQANKLSQLEKKNVSLLIASGAHDNIFEMVDAVSNKNRKEALKRLHDQLKSGNHELEIVSMLVRQFRIITQVKDGINSGWSSDQTAKHFGMHPFVAKKMSQQARKISDKAIEESYNALINLDADVKSSGLPPSLLLSTTVAKISC